ncbi:MAG: hypothetical protein ACXWCT_15305 [Flavitalea sp.]
MNDKLKKYIQDNRTAFDSEEPGAGLFTKMEHQLLGFKKKSGWTPWRWAAVFTGLALLSATFFLIPARNKNGTKEIPVVIQPNNTIKEDISFIGDASYAKQIYHFRELIGLKQAELEQLKADYPDLYKQFVTDINELDSSYQSLKINLAENPNREMLLEAMIQNLQLQSELLNRQLMIIKEIKQKNKSHEKSTV